MKASLSRSLFLLFFQLIKEREMDTKELIRGDMKMGEGGKRGSRSDAEKRREEQRSLSVRFECMRGAESEQPALATVVLLALGPEGLPS